MAASEALSRLRTALLEGLVIPAHPLALTAERRLDERRQVALTRYYADAGAGGIAVGVHSTQFAIRAAGLFEPVLRLAAEAAAQARAADGPRAGQDRGGDRPDADRRVAEAETAQRLGYDAVLLSLGALARRERAASSSRTAGASARCCRSSASTSSPRWAAGRSTRRFWRRFLEIDAVVAVKVAPFNRYQTLDVVRALAASGRAGEVALYTGNDDAIVLRPAGRLPGRSARSASWAACSASGASGPAARWSCSRR